MFPSSHFPIQPSYLSSDILLFHFLCLSTLFVNLCLFLTFFLYMKKIFFISFSSVKFIPHLIAFSFSFSLSFHLSLLFSLSSFFYMYVYLNFPISNLLTISFLSLFLFPLSYLFLSLCHTLSFTQPLPFSYIHQSFYDLCPDPSDPCPSADITTLSDPGRMIFFLAFCQLFFGTSSAENAGAYIRLNEKALVYLSELASEGLQDLLKVQLHSSNGFLQQKSCALLAGRR